MTARKPAPTLLPCGHFSTTERDGKPACGICIEKAAIERIKAETVTVHETGPDQYGCDRHPKGVRCRCYWGD